MKAKRIVVVWLAAALLWPLAIGAIALAGQFGRVRSGRAHDRVRVTI